MTAHDSTHGAPGNAFIETILNLSHYHREHELFYSHAPLEVASRLQVTSRALKSLALHWQAWEPNGPAQKAPTGGGPKRYAGCEDLNEPVATQTLGILFMEGEGEPAEIGKLKDDLEATATEHDRAGHWLGEAMTGSWDAATALVTIPSLAETLGDRHRIIINNWLMATNSTLISRLLRRAMGLLVTLELNPEAIRQDLGGARTAPALLLSVAELIDHAADLSAHSALLVHDSEPRWRRFRSKVGDLASGASHGVPIDSDPDEPST